MLTLNVFQFYFVIINIILFKNKKHFYKQIIILHCKVLFICTVDFEKNQRK